MSAPLAMYRTYSKVARATTTALMMGLRWVVDKSCNLLLTIVVTRCPVLTTDEAQATEAVSLLLLYCCYQNRTGVYRQLTVHNCRGQSLASRCSNHLVSSSVDRWI